MKSARLQNIQSHKDTTLNFVPGINAIVGTSDAGKSVVKRLLEWVCHNRPQGDVLCSDWGGPHIGSVVFDDKAEVIRTKHKQKNEYLLKREGEEDMPFKSFRNDVPELIANHVNMLDLNWQGQHDNTFMLSKNAGDVAKELNEIVQLDIIDKATSCINHNARVVQGSITAHEALLETQKTKLETFGYLGDMEKDVVELEGLCSDKACKRLRIAALLSVLTSVERAEAQVAKYAGLAKLTAMAKELANLQAARDSQELLHNQLLALGRSISQTRKRITRYDKVLELESQVQELKGLEDDGVGLHTRVAELTNLIGTIEVSEGTIETQTARVARLTAKKDAAVEAAKVCGECGRPL